MEKDYRIRPPAASMIQDLQMRSETDKHGTKIPNQRFELM
jgi:hypothetical protein